jgi:putative phosphoribosyl transferase
MAEARFKDRADAGRRLSRDLGAFAARDDVVVLALPRGGVPVAYEVARELGVALDVFLVLKLGVPGRDELAVGAIASGGVRVVNERVARQLGMAEGDIAHVAADAQRELERRERAYRSNRPELDVAGWTVILVDDGLATGSTMRAAATALGAQRPAHVVVAVPVAERDACAAFRDEVDEVICVLTPEPFRTVEAWYEDFEPVSDDEVRALLDRAAAGTGS